MAAKEGAASDSLIDELINRLQGAGGANRTQVSASQPAGRRRARATGRAAISACPTALFTASRHSGVQSATSPTPRPPAPPAGARGRRRARRGGSNVPPTHTVPREQPRGAPIPNLPRCTALALAPLDPAPAPYLSPDTPPPPRHPPFSLCAPQRSVPLSEDEVRSVCTKAKYVARTPRRATRTGAKGGGGGGERYSHSMRACAWRGGRGQPPRAPRARAGARARASAPGHMHLFLFSPSRPEHAPGTRRAPSLAKKPHSTRPQAPRGEKGAPCWREGRQQA